MTAIRGVFQSGANAPRSRGGVSTERATDSLSPSAPADYAVISAQPSRRAALSSPRLATVLRRPPRARLALSKAEAAEAFGCSVDFLEERVLPELRVVRRGRRVFIVIAELQRWLDANGARVLE